jgi:hypothetical protein
MADRNKFEEMLEKLVNEDRKGAEELFHEIVVEKSRQIYENLLEDDMEDLDVKESDKDDEEVDEASENDDEETNEATDEDEKTDESKDEEVDEASDDEEVAEDIPVELTPEGDDDMGGDPADDMMADIEDDAEGEDKPEGDEEIEDRVVDLEDALDDLKAEFEKMMGDKEEGDDDGEEDSEAPMDDMGDEEKEDEAFEPTSELSVDEVPAFEGTKSQAEQMREYVEKVSAPSNNAEKSKSPVAGKNDMGGSAKNIAQGSAEEKGGTGASAPKVEDHGNVNVPGGKASKSMSNAKAPDMKGEKGADKDSIIGS